MSAKLTRRHFLQVSSAAVAGVGLGATNASGASAFELSGQSSAVPVSGLEVFQVAYPRVIQFREAEYSINDGLTYEQWAERSARTSGLVGKALEESQPMLDGGQRHIDYYTQFKQDHPEKLVIVHHHDTALNPVPVGALDEFWSGHWLYFEGTQLIQDLGESDTVLHLDEISFRERGGFRDDLNYRNTNGDDIVITRMGPDGKPDWNHTEHASITEVDYDNNTITVQRGAYGSTPLTWESGSYVAPHVRHPNMNTNLRWLYNLSTEAPVDPLGRQGIDAFVDDLVRSFGPGGPLEAVDGIEFDQARFEVCCGATPDIDADGDGVADGGVFGDVNTYGVGKVDFYEKLKLALPGKLVLADGSVEANQQRGFHILNGMESEGWPDSRDKDFENWSVGLNRHRFWNANSASPALSYIVHKYDGFASDPDEDFPEGWLSTQRLMTAGAVFTDSPVTVRFVGSEGDSDFYGELYDELRKGVDGETNWMGFPSGPAIHLAAQSPDLLNGSGETWAQEFVDQFSSPDATLSRGDSPVPHLKITPDPQSGPYRERGANFTLPGIQNEGDDLFVTATVRAEPIQEYPSTIARKFGISAVNRTTNESRASFTWMNQISFEATFSFRDIGSGTIDLEFGPAELPVGPGPNATEGDTPFYLERLTVHSAADAMYREFDNGVAFANPSTSNYTFDLAQLLPGVELQRLEGDMSPDVNNGEVLGDALTIGPKDALFVTKAATWASATALVNAYFGAELLGRTEQRQLLTHLSIAERLADQEVIAQAQQALDRFIDVASGVDDPSAREDLLAAAAALRAEL